MPIQELAPVTLAEVEESIRGFEDQYKFTSADFLNISGTNVADDDAAEWNYLLLQREALRSRADLGAVPDIKSGARVHQWVYGRTRFGVRSGTVLDERRLQYDCAA